MTFTVRQSETKKSDGQWQEAVSVDRKVRHSLLCESFGTLELREPMGFRNQKLSQSAQVCGLFTDEGDKYRIALHRLIGLPQINRDMSTDLVEPFYIQFQTVTFSKSSGRYVQQRVNKIHT